MVFLSQGKKTVYHGLRAVGLGEHTAIGFLLYGYSMAGEPADGILGRKTREYAQQLSVTTGIVLDKFSWVCLRVGQVTAPSARDTYFAEGFLTFFKNQNTHMGGFFSYIDSSEKPTSTCAYYDYIGYIFHI